MNEKCYLYIFKQIDSKIIKIGISGNPTARLRQVINSSGFDCRLIMKVAYASRDEAYHVEQKIHSKYSRHRARGEWFNIGVCNEIQCSDFSYGRTHVNWYDLKDVKKEALSNDAHVNKDVKLVIKNPISPYPEMRYDEVPDNTGASASSSNLLTYILGVLRRSHRRVA